MDDPRTYETCGDCMYLRIDRSGTCWPYCEGKYKPEKGKVKLWGRMSKEREKENEEKQIFNCY